MLMSDTPESVRSAIEATIRDYIEGWYEGDAARMDRSLHHDLLKRTREADNHGSAQFREVTKERMVALTSAGGGESPGADYEIEVHHVSGEIASAHVRSPEYLDYLQLIETDACWKIANILFRTH
jgi:hypothetical protein